MFYSRELRLVDNSYFNMIRCVTDLGYVEIQSKNTQHYWIIRKLSPSVSKFPFILYHKHPGQPYYHCHWKCFQMAQSVNSIMSHDRYVLRNGAC